MKFNIGRFIAYMSRKFKFGYNLRRIVCTLHGELLKCMITSFSILLGMRNFSVKVVEINEKLVLISVTFFTKIVTFMR
jgi:hypothetical protein